MCRLAIVLVCAVCSTLLSCIVKIDGVEAKLCYISVSDGQLFLLYRTSSNNLLVIDSSNRMIKEIHVPEKMAIEISSFEYSAISNNLSVLYWTKERWKYCFYSSETGKCVDLSIPEHITYITLSNCFIDYIVEGTKIYRYDIINNESYEITNLGYGIPIYTKDGIVIYWDKYSLFITKEDVIIKALRNPDWVDHRMVNISIENGNVIVVYQIPLNTSKVYYSQSCSETFISLGSYNRLTCPVLLGSFVYFISVPNMYDILGRTQLFKIKLE